MSGSLIVFFRGTRNGALVGVAIGSLDVCRTLLVSELRGGLAGRYATGVFAELAVYAVVGFAFASVARIIGAVATAPVRDRLRRAPRGEFVERTVFAALWVPALVFGLLPESAHDPSGVTAVCVFAFAAAVLVTRVRAGESAQSPVSRIIRGICLAVAMAGCAAAVFAATQLDLASLAGRATAAWQTVAEPGENERPDIVLITADTLRADRLPAYGGTTVTTPTLDRLASESIVFERMAAQSPWTRASFGSIWTGLTPSLHGATWRILRGENDEDITLSSRPLDANVTTMPESFAAAGYLTVGINNNIQTSAEFGFARGFKTWIDVSRPVDTMQDSLLCRTAAVLSELPSCPFTGGDASGYPYLPAEQLTPIAVEILARLENVSAPVFVWIHYMDPHVPYDSHDGRDAALTYETIREGLVDDADAIRASLQNAYDAEIEYMDAQMARVLERIDGLARTRRAVVAFTADHGEELVERWKPASERAAGRFFEHRGYGHGHTMYEELLHVPFFLRLPDRSRAGERIGSAVQHTDLLPTLIALAGISAQTSRVASGRDVSNPAFASGTDSDARVLISEHSLYGPELKQARRGSLKLVFHTDGSAREMYDLEADPHENRSLNYASSPQGRDLDIALMRWMSALPVVDETAGAAAANSPGEPPGLRRQLEALGYIDR